VNTVLGYRQSMVQGCGYTIRIKHASFVIQGQGFQVLGLRGWASW